MDTLYKQEDGRKPGDERRCDKLTTLENLGKVLRDPDGRQQGPLCIGSQIQVPLKIMGVFKLLVVFLMLLVERRYCYWSIPVRNSAAYARA